MNDSHSNDKSMWQQPDDAVWDQIAEKVDALVEQWERYQPDGSPPRLGDLLADVDPKFQRFVACELIKIDLEERWQGNVQPLKLEDYVQQIPQLGKVAELPSDLIYEEVQIRLQVGDVVQFAELAQRFPNQADQLEKLVGSSAAPGTPSFSLNQSVSKQETLQVGETSLKTASFQVLCEGDSIDDFDLLLLLGSGSFARVFLARQRSLERLVALKISKDVGSEPRTLAQLDHPNIVRVFDVRSCNAPVARLLYMELVPGGTLHDVIQHANDASTHERTGRLVLETVDMNLAASGIAPPEGSEIRRALGDANWHRAVCLIGYRLADGLAYAHEKGVLHRDIKPANVLLTPEGSPKLADFNISFQGGRADENPGDTFGGSLAYMSPEQLEACHPLLGGTPTKVRHASDIYSLGVLLWELATGTRPFSDATTSSGWALSIQRMIDDRREANFDDKQAQLPDRLPASLSQVLRTCLDSDPESRYQSARQLAFTLHLCLHPRCWELLQPPSNWFTRLPLRFVVATILMATLVPSVLAAVFNYVYNKEEIAQHLGPDGEATLMQVQMVINAIAFPIGIAIVIWAARRCANALNEPSSRDPANANVLSLGKFMAVLAMTLWVTAGFAYPIAFEFMIEGGVESGVYVHFFLSLALCGALAGTYPFFLVSLVCIRWILPELIRREIVSGPRRADVQRLRRTNRWFVGLTALVPLLGILLILIGHDDLLTAQRDMIIASLTGIIGFAAMFWLHRFIDEDLAALEELSGVES